MKDLLHPRHRSALARLAGEDSPARLLLAFDYDGVLAPVVRDPAGAPMRATTRALLAELVRRYPVAVVSGRSYRDLARMVEGIVPDLVGNHGFELLHERPVPAAVLRSVRRWIRQVEEALAGVPGVHVEDKASTFAVHYGLSRRWRAAERAVYAVARALPGTRLVPGKKLVNVLPRDFPTKGDAVQALLARAGVDVALYLGDDVTDEDVFALGAPRVFGVHVGAGRSLAPWRIARQADVDAVLRRLVALREPAGAKVRATMARAAAPARRAGGRA
jgi:trehalose 6-phosphate phosphatase